MEDFDEYYKRDTVNTTQFPWTEAQRSRKNIEAALALKGKNASPNLLRYVNDYHQELFLSQVGNPRAVSYEVSNIGIVGADDVRDENKPALGRLVFSQCANVVGGAVMVSVATGGDGCLAVAFTWQTGVVEDQLMEAVVRGAKEELRGLASCSR